MPQVKRFVPRLLMLSLALWSSAALAASPARFDLRDGWDLQSARLVGEEGATLSTPQYRPQGWYRTAVPSTVVAAQVAAGELPDPYVGMNLRQIPGTTYPVGENYTLLPMPADSPYASGWWYRKEFALPRDFAGRTAWLHFGGINYRANIWLNGRQLAGAGEVAGAYRIYELDATSLLQPGEKNVLAVETFAPTPTDLAINWVDWNPTPPDKDMGLWGDVYLLSSGPVSLRHPFVTTHFVDPSLGRADLTVRAELRNTAARPIAAVVDGEIEGVRFSQPVELKPGEERAVVFTPEQFPQLRIAHPKVWWPAEMGPQDLHTLTMRVAVDGVAFDEQQTRFGIREITAERAAAVGHPGEVFAANVKRIIPVDKRSLLFRVNGRRILIRGGGWTSDMLLRFDRRRLETELRYVRHMNLNTIRLEGKLERDELYDLADEMGILVMAGWCCCDHWEDWERWKPGDLEIATASLRDQIRRLRSHPSLLIWLNGSDGPPPANVEQAYIGVLQREGWPNPYTSSAAAAAAASGPSGVKMPGPYDFVPPSYWTADPKLYGGPLGFNTETGPGAAIPPRTQLAKMLGADHLWPIDDFWKFHAGSRSFRDFKKFNAGMNAIYGAPADLDDYLRKAQAMNYDGERAMFEAYGGNKYDATGVIQWMLNNGWPSLFWHLYDFYLQPAGGYYGTRKACEPLHVQFSYADRRVVVVNNRETAYRGLTVDAAVYDLDMKERFSRRARLDVDADGRGVALTVPPPPAGGPSAVTFLALTLSDAAGETLSTNFYWLPTKPTTFEWAKTDSTYTPASAYEDLTALNDLPRARVEASASVAGDRVTVRLHNPGPSLAFLVHLGLHQGDASEEIIPTFWDDNYVALLPGASRVITARAPSADALGAWATLRVSGWNVEPVRLSLVPATH